MKKAYAIRFYGGFTDKKGQPVNSAVYTRVMNERYGGYNTVFPATGCWKGKMEHTLVFEVVFCMPSVGIDWIERTKEDLRKAGNQEAVLVTRQEIEAEI